MLRDVFYYGSKPNVHPREQFAKSLADARKKATTEHFWVINEYCDYTGFDWDFDFEFLPDEDVWAENHNNVWPSVHQKDSGTWLCAKQRTDVIVYRADVTPLKRKNIQSSQWKLLENINTDKWDFSWHPDPTDPPYIYKWGCKYFPVEFKSCIEYHVDGATQIKYMNAVVELLPNENCIVEVQKVDRSRWDMSWRPDPLDPPYIYVWGNEYIDGKLRSTLEYHAPGATEKKYMPELVPVLPEWDRWELLHEVDKTTFDFCWRPDPREPDFIYVFGNEQYDSTVMPTIEYRMPNATVKKYVTNVIAKLSSHPEKFQHLEKADGIDYSWVPDPTAPPYIYAWGNQWNKPEDKISIQYVVEGATEYKYMTERANRKPCMDNWEVPENIDTTGFDFSWEPSPADPAYIYEFGTQHQKTGGPRYVVEGATEVKYIDVQKAKALVTKNNWTIPDHLDITGFDFSWHPDSTSPPYIYHFATQWALTGGPIYTCENATETKYLDSPSAIALPNRDNWEIPSDINVDKFDFSWHPYIEDQPYVYVFGTQHQKTGGPKYVTPGVIPTSPVKYIDTRILKAEKLANKKNFATLGNYKIKDFDYSWHPDDTEEPYIYVFGNNQYSAEIMPTIEYRVKGAKQIKYVTDIVATLDVDMINWEVPNDVDTSGFDFSWKPNPKDPPYIYQFGTQWQKTGGPRYVVPDATEVKYVTTQSVKKLANKKKFAILNNLVIKEFDYSWHPDDTEEPYIYVFGNNQYSAEIMPTIEYVVPGATQIKYVNNIIATLGIDNNNWEIPEYLDTSKFDFSWKPNPKDPALIYQFGTQWQKTGGPQYVVPDATDIKYVDNPKAISLPNKDKFTVLDNLIISDFDYSWHPDTTEEPYIYHFGNSQYPAEIMPTIEYAVGGATQIKYVSHIKATLGVDMTNWIVPTDIDVTAFDFSWKPNPKDPAFIYQFGTQWQKTGGPRYVVPNATEVKYISTQKAKALPTNKYWEIPNNLDITGFDFSWHPDDTSPPYVYHFATQWALTGGPIYRMPNANETKYLEEPSAIALPNKENWEVPIDIDSDDFDYSWHPYIEDQPYVYQFGTQWQKTGGPRYVTPGVIPTSPVKYIDTRILKSKKLPSKKNFAILNNYKIKGFDYSWHPDDTEESYIYVFGNNQHPAEIMPTIEYKVPGATQIKYVPDVVAILDVDMTNWEVPNNIDTSEFDFSWKPNPKDPPFIYQFGTQWQKTGGPRYIVADATEVKYVTTQQAKALVDMSHWTIPPHVDVTNFDFSWHPDDTSPAYVYHFATQWALTGGPVYTVPGATETKYLEEPSAIALVNKENWEIPKDVDIESFDFSWHPYIEDQPYIYKFGTQWQKTGGPKYITPGVIATSPTKYIDTRILKAKKLANKKHFAILNNYKIKDFDYSWHPDETEEPYIYVFGNTQHPAEVMPTIEYKVPGAKQIKYIHDVVATLDVDMTNWEIPDNIDTTDFDFSWKPNPKDPAYIYEFGTQHQKTGGPRYVVPDATEVKYVTTQIVKALPTTEHWELPTNIDVTGFDFSWHPDNTSPPYIYHFATQWALSGGPIYRVPNATEVKYMDSPSAIALPNRDNWEVPKDIDDTEFDFSWHPYVEDQPYIYQFGTQHQKTGGPKYITPGVISSSPIKYIDTRILKAKRKESKKHFSILGNYRIESFDYSWHPDDTDEPFIYLFGNTQYPPEVMPTIEYAVPGAKQIKYVHDIVVKLAPDMTNWTVPKNIDITGFDFSWKPNPNDPPYIYQFGTQWQKTGGPKYIVEGATQVKYVDTMKVKALPTYSNWSMPPDLVIDEFDYSWHPNETEEPYVYQFGTQWALTGGPKFIVEGAMQVKYMDLNFAKVDINMKNWILPENTHIENFDYSWHPHPDDPPFIYVFGTQWYDRGGPKYMHPLATEMSPLKYIDTRVIKATLGVNKANWKIPNDVDVSDFDFSWIPHPEEPTYIYQFGTQHQKTGGPTYIPSDSNNKTPVKYVNTLKARKLANKDNFNVLNDIEIIRFDYSWHPDETEEPYIYVFGNNQYSAEVMPTVEYTMPGATKIKYVHDVVAMLKPDKKYWKIPEDIDASQFDFSWIPNPGDPTYIYQFGTQWQKTDGPAYYADGAVVGKTPIKYVEHPKAVKLPSEDNWIIPDGVDITTFDFSWHPDSTSPPYIYQFGTVLDDIHLEDGPKYITPNNNGHIVHMDINIAKLEKIEYPKYYIKTTLEDLIAEHSNEIFWALRDNIDYTSFDFTWKPTKQNIFNVNVFGSPESELTQTYFVNAKLYAKGYQDKHFLEQDKKVDDINLAKMFKKLDMFMVDKGNPEAQERFEKLKAKFGNVQKTRYLNTWVDTINRCINRSTTNLCWILNSELDYDDFDFEYYPNPWQMKMVHVFGTQWSHWGTTFIVNKDTFPADTKYIKIIEHLSNLNFVKDRTAKATSIVHDVVYIDYGNATPPTDCIVVKYENDYLTTFKNILKQLPQKKEQYIWIKSSVCDYTNFDFTYICDPFAREQLHVFPSDKQKFGDTFFVNVNKLRELVDSMETLKDYDKINYNQHQRVKRLEAPTIITPFDTHVGSVLTDFDFPYAVFVTEDNKDIKVVDDEPMSLWDTESKNILITSTGGTRIVVPKEAKDYVETQLYDYPYIKTASRLAKSTPMDIVFLSNGEQGADENYEHLLQITKGLPNRIVRVDGVKGRVQAYHAAAEASNTAWLLTVFAKLKVNPKFDFNWQPDRLQIPKHYMFLAKNPVNGLIYGHQGMIAYNKEMTLGNEGHGLDFTLDSPHETIELLSGTANFNTDEFSTWRTAFREAIKLKKDGTEISLQRLEAWLTKADGSYAQYSLDGANDAMAYYNKVKGKTDKLRMSYEWDWLRKQFNKKYKKK